jgi:hypothetical protein
MYLLDPEVFTTEAVLSFCKDFYNRKVCLPYSKFLTTRITTPNMTNFASRTIYLSISHHLPHLTESTIPRAS